MGIEARFTGRFAVAGVTVAAFSLSFCFAHHQPEPAPSEEMTGATALSSV